VTLGAPPSYGSVWDIIRYYNIAVATQFLKRRFVHPHQLWEYSSIVRYYHETLWFVYSFPMLYHVTIQAPVVLSPKIPRHVRGGGVSPPQIPFDDRGGEYLFSPDSPSDRGGEYTSRGFLDIFVRDSVGLFIELYSAPLILPRGFEPVRRLRGPIKVILAAI